MNKNNLLLSAFCILIASSNLVASELTINDNVTLKKQITYDKSSTVLRLKTIDVSKNVVASSIKKLVIAFKDNPSISVVETSVYPDYKFFKGVQSFEGYNGNVVLNVKFNTKESLEDIMQQISTFNFNVSQEPIKKEISEKTKEETRKTLKGKILEKVNNDVISHSKSTGLKCLVSKVNFSSNRYDYSASNKKTAVEESLTPNIDTANNIVEVIVDAKVTFSCNKAKKNINKKAKKKKNTNKKKNHHKKADTIVKSYEISKVSR